MTEFHECLLPVQGLVQTNAGTDGAPLARNPKVVEAPAASEPLYAAFATDADDPPAVSVPFQACVMLCPALRFHFTVQPLTGAAPAVTVTSPWNPPGHEFWVW